MLEIHSIKAFQFASNYSTRLYVEVLYVDMFHNINDDMLKLIRTE